MTDNQAAEYADTVKESIEEMMTALDPDRDSSALDDTYDDVREALDNYPLEIVHQIGSPFEVVITVGGPDARIVHDMRFTSWTLEVAWGGDVAVRRSSSITAMGEYFLSMVDDS